MVILNTWQECMLEDATAQFLFVFLIIIAIIAWVMLITYKDSSSFFLTFLSTFAVIIIFWANQYPETYHIIDVSNASFLEVCHDYEIISPVEGSTTLYKVREKPNDHN